ncbi:MAG: hypothetical protein FJ150_04585 [Euryarchaeota archaeon]|nr:hypothetical protein [Euryarchaeota archaeon]
MEENFLVFYYADRIKAFLIETLRVFDFYLELEKSEDLEKLMLQVLKSSQKEVNLAKSVCSKIDWARLCFMEVSQKIEEGVSHFTVGNHENLKESFRLALSKVSTCAGKALDIMENEGS